jgi:hypothetical protein
VGEYNYGSDCSDNFSPGEPDSATVTSTDDTNVVTAQATGCESGTPEIVASAGGVSRFEDSINFSAGEGAGSVLATVELTGNIDSDRGPVSYEFVFDAGDELNGSFTNNASLFAGTQGSVNETLSLAFDFVFRSNDVTPITFESELSVGNDATAKALLLSLTIGGGVLEKEPQPEPEPEEDLQPVNLVLDWVTPVQRDSTAAVDSTNNAVNFAPIAGERPPLSVDLADPGVRAFANAWRPHSPSPKACPTSKSISTTCWRREMRHSRPTKL